LAEDLEITERLRKTSERTAAEGEMQGLFVEILDAAVSILKADAGTMQLLQAETDTLLMLASKGFSPEMVSRFATVETKSGSSCGMALETGTRSFVDFDDPNIPDPDGAKRVHVEAGLHSAQCTPLIARSGRTVGMLSTHWREHCRPTDRQLSFLDLLARQAADAIERQQASDLLHVHMEELTRFNDAAMGRETRMIELKKEINELAARHGEPARYPLEFENEN
jgi:GAF domain-containing protein